MPWSKLDDGLHENAKIAAMSDKAFRLYICAITYSARHRLQGFLAFAHVAVLFRLTGAKQKHADELVALKAWELLAEGYKIHDHEHYNPTPEEISKKRSDAGKKGAESRWQNGKPIANAIEPNGKGSWQTDGKGTCAQTRARNPDPVPDPNPIESQSNTGGGPLGFSHPDLATIQRWASDLGRSELADEFFERMDARGWLTLEKNAVPITSSSSAYSALRRFIAHKSQYEIADAHRASQPQSPNGRRLTATEQAAAQMERELEQKARGG